MCYRLPGGENTTNFSRNETALEFGSHLHVYLAVGLYYLIFQFLHPLICKQGVLIQLEVTRGEGTEARPDFWVGVHLISHTAWPCSGLILSKYSHLRGSCHCLEMGRSWQGPIFPQRCSGPYWILPPCVFRGHFSLSREDLAGKRNKHFLTLLEFRWTLVLY